ncbi:MULTISPECIES: BTAD domain-containing putative transcriptional regulator [unclassified Frankia]|uniref:BTAD domain-containing putative transcriptional regulator n=1 Tax=unclassified Frankia TaxID=2632575 RepID=UPI002AD3D453|nr:MULTISPECIES: BTAD domain-containing putative transcriptional regulator [unclassified Frankia]
MALRLLGPLDLAVGGRSLHLGGPRQQIVLAMLSLNVNSVTSIDQLIEAVWQEDPPPTARGQIQVCISGLRKLFAEAGFPDAIRTRVPGYVLELGANEVDSLRFTGQLAAAKEQIDAGRTADAVRTLRAALALWNGTALAGVQSELIRRGATALDEKRLAAIEDCVRLELKLGWHEELIVELQALVGEHPLRERLHGFLMLALYRSGRQAEALGIFRQARTTLIEEVGIEPGQELQDLELAILNRDPRLGVPQVNVVPHDVGPAVAYPPQAYHRRTLPRQLPAGISDFTGRVAEIVEIRKLLSRNDGAASAGHAMQIVALSGRGGVGKSTLAIRVAHILNDDFEDGVLYAELQSSTSPDRAAVQLARFLRALGVSGAAIPDDVGERGELYRSCLAAKRVLVVLDDVVNEEQVLPLLPGSPSCAVITSSRNRLTGLPGAHHVAVEAFDAAESVEMLTKIIGTERVRAEETAATELGELCDGLPLALRIAAAKLASRTRWQLGRLVHRLRDEVRRLDELEHRGWELRSSIGLTYENLEEPAKRLFRRLAMIQAPDVRSWTAAALLDTDVAVAEDVLESLVDAHVLETVVYPDARGLRYRFHDLIRVYARERLIETEAQDERDAVLVRVLGAWLALAEAAHRKEYGGDYTVIHGNAPRWRPPDADPEEVVGDPMDWWDSERPALVAAVRHAAESGLDELCWDLALTCTTLFESRGYFDDWHEVAQTAHDAAHRAGNRTGVAAMLYSIGTLNMFQSRLAEADMCFRAAMDQFDAAGNEHGFALVLRNSAHVDGIRGDSDAMVAKYDRALMLLRRVDDRIGAAHVMRSQAKHWLSVGDLDRAQLLLEQALDTCRQLGCIRVEAQVLHSFADLHVLVGELEMARQELHRVLRIVRDGGDRIGEAHALYGLGVVRYREGRLDSAATTIAHALELASGAGERLIEAKACHTLGEIEIAQGNTESGPNHLEGAKRLFQELGSGVWTAKSLVLLSDFHRKDGDPLLARQELNEALEILTADGSAEARRVLVELSKQHGLCDPVNRSASHQ